MVSSSFKNQVYVLWFFFLAVSELLILVAYVTTLATTTATTTRKLHDQARSHRVDAEHELRTTQGGQDKKERQDEGVLPMHQAGVPVRLQHQEELRWPLPSRQMVMAHLR